MATINCFIGLFAFQDPIKVKSWPPMMVGGPSSVAHSMVPFSFFCSGYML